MSLIGQLIVNLVGRHAAFESGMAKARGAVDTTRSSVQRLVREGIDPMTARMSYFAGSGAARWDEGMRKIQSANAAATQSTGRFGQSVVGAAAGSARFQTAVGNLAFRLVGVQGPLTKIIETIGTIGVGGAVMTAALGGLAVLSFAWLKLTESTRKAHKEYEEYMKALRGGNTPLAIVGEELDAARVRLTEMEALAGAGGSGALGASPEAIAKQKELVNGLKGQYDGLYATIGGDARRKATERTEAEIERLQKLTAEARDLGSAASLAGTGIEKLFAALRAGNADEAARRLGEIRAQLQGIANEQRRIRIEAGGGGNVILPAGTGAAEGELPEILQGNAYMRGSGYNAMRERQRAQAARDAAEARAANAQRRAAIQEEADFYVEAWRQAARNVQDILADTIAGSVNSLKDVLRNILDAVNQIVSQLAAQGIIRGAGDLFWSLFGGMHAGGTVGGVPSLQRAVSPLAFVGAPRMHGGGRVGLASDEVPVILQEGETVLPRGARSSRGMSVNWSPTVHFHVNAIDAKGVSALFEENRGVIARQTLEAMRENSLFAALIRGG